MYLSLNPQEQFKRDCVWRPNGRHTRLPAVGVLNRGSSHTAANEQSAIAPVYSLRKAPIGSTRVALRAGK